LFIWALTKYISATGDLTEWKDLDDALKEAGEKNKPVLVNVYSRFNQVSKNMNLQIFQNPKTKEYLEENFVLAGINAGTDKNSALLDSVYNVQGVPSYLFLATSGKELFRFSKDDAFGIVGNFTNPELQEKLKKDIQYFLSWDDYNTAVKKAFNSGKHVIIAAAKEPESARKIMYIFDGESTQQYIEKHFIPVFLNSANNDHSFIIENLEKKYLAKKEAANDDETSIKLQIGDIVDDFILILDKNGNYVTHFNPSPRLYDEDAMNDKLKISLSNTEKTETN